MRRRVAVRPCPGIGEAVCGIAGLRAGTGEQGGTGSIPHKTHAHKFFKTVDCLKANTPHGWVDGGLSVGGLREVGWCSVFSSGLFVGCNCGRVKAQTKHRAGRSRADCGLMRCYKMTT